ncbi:hypothetical protein [Candidatus Magnetominusculus xianensis]|uniref:Secreted protein n=1 Tax=Candidatus Magnetominusculus xianensis TaxID=1748249 RepID=A0ABR5SKC7_9BACT|nr:hypothetical protein [Candidatus Magnetominusculus xianensis]KWT92675.1 hypothetical protein ASN18_0506 [Candidatus Magnetominusculus xianensis]MBF0403774.1 hypothetical protein [Nitrospirota bacterium]
MFTQKAATTLIMLIVVFCAVSAVEGDDLYCVSLRKDFKISNRIFYGIMSADFKVTNAELYKVLHKPIGWVLSVWKDNEGEGGLAGGALVFAGSVRLNFFYDDFVIIKKKSGVKLNDVKLTLKLETDETINDGANDNNSNADKTYDFTNKDFNIRRCKDKLY